jgi:D-alanyl-D-alanine carboxypeptidase
MHTTNRLLVALALVGLVLTASSPAPALATTRPAGGGATLGVTLARPSAVAVTPRAPGPKVASGFAILVDARTGAVMWTRHATTSRPPASLTKMLSALLIRASLPPTAVVVTNRDAARTAPTRLGLRPGQKITVSQALAAMMVLSANDMAVLLADRSAGSVRRFSQAMNLASARLGLRQSSWHSPNGLPTRGHVSSAFDLAIVARAVLRDPWLARMVRTERVVFTTPDHHRHELHAHSAFLKLYKGAVGVKTGFTDDAGRCLAAAATRNGRTLIAIVLHSPNPPADAMQLMNWGFGPGRSATTGQVLPPYAATPSVRSLLAPAPTTTVAPAGAGPAEAGSRAALGSRLDRWREDMRLPIGIGASAGVALLAGTGLMVRRRRRRPTTPE